MLRKFLLNILFSLFVFIIPGESQPLYFNNYKVEPETPVSNVRGITQDERGFMWIATSSKVYRFNGLKFSPIEITFSNLNCYYTSICFIGDNRLLIGSNNGIFLYNYYNRKVKHFQADANHQNTLKNNLVSDIFQDSEGNVWIGHYDGLSLFDIDQEKFYNYSPDNLDFINSGNWIYSIAEENDTTLWLGAFKGGVMNFNKNSCQFKKYHHSKNKTGSLSDNKVRRVKVDPKGNVWVCTWDGGLNLYDPDNDNFIKIYTGPTSQHNQINDILHWRKDHYLLATERGLLLYKKNTEAVEFISAVLQKGSDNVPTIIFKKIYEDVKGNLWLGSYHNGLFYMFNGQQKFCKHQTQMVFDFYHYKDDKVFLELKNNLSLWSAKAGIISNAPARQINYFDRQKRAWIYEDGFIKTSNPSDYKNFIAPFSKKQIPEMEKGNGTFFSYTEDTTGNIIIRADTSIYIADKNLSRVRQIDIPLKIRNEYDFKQVNFFEMDQQQRLWIIMKNQQTGIFSIHNNQLVFIKNIHTPCGGAVYFMKEAGNDKYWLSTNCGLYKYIYATDEYIKCDKNDNFLGNKPLAINYDNNNKLWIQYSRGLSCFDPVTEEVYNYPSEYGIQTNITAKQPTPLCLPDGLMIFRYHDGFFYFYPDSLNINTEPPELIFERFVLIDDTSGLKAEYISKSNGKEQSIELNYHQNDFAFYFSCLDYSNPKLNYFNYRLKGLNDNWIRSYAINKAAFYDVPPGKYIFELKVRNGRGIWSKNNISIPLTIIPPFYQRTLFKVGVIILVVIIIVAIFLFRLRAVHRRNILLNSMVEERTNDIEEQKDMIDEQAKDLEEKNTLLQNRHKELEIANKELSRTNEELDGLNATKDRLFSIIAHDLRNPLTVISSIGDLLKDHAGDPKKQEEYLSLIMQSALTASDLLENLLNWAKSQTIKIKPRFVVFDILELIDKTIQITAAHQEKKSITIKNQISPGTFVYADKDMVFTIIRNIIGNAIKYTPVGETINIKCASESIRPSKYLFLE